MIMFKRISRKSVVVGLNVLLLGFAWYRHSQGIDPQHLGFQLTAMGLFGATLIGALLLLIPLIMRHFSTHPLNVSALIERLSWGYLGYAVLFLMVPQWFQPTVLRLMGPLATLIGAIMVDTPRNGFLGIRVSWTYESPIVWRKTNAVGGWLLLVGGVILFVVTGWQPAWSGHTIVVLMLLLTGVTLPYAWWQAQRLTK